MKYLALLTFAAFLLWGLGVVREDAERRKIPNARIAAGLKLLFFALALQALNTALGMSGRADSFLNPEFYRLLAGHLAWTAAAGMVLWYSELWPAGDAKFFMVASAFLPLIHPFVGGMPGYLFLVFLINTFIAASLYVLGSYVAEGFRSAAPSEFFAKLRGDARQRLAAIAGENGRAAVAPYLLNLGFIFLLQQILMKELSGALFRVFSHTGVLFFFMFFLWDKIAPYFRSRAWMRVSAVSYALYFGLGLLFFSERLFEVVLGAGSNVARFSALIFVGRFMLEYLMEKKDLVYLPAAEVKEGVILSAAELRVARNNPVFEGAFEDCFKDGLSEEQARLLREWMGRLAEKVPDPKIETVKGRPFALWIYAGALLTLFLDRNLGHYIR
ncbi:MAG: hypothetical protein RDU13_01945 [Elusimicrobiales bacterium]|nr:hypothetical protein [Elusimicrobiales bacterium]